MRLTYRRAEPDDLSAMIDRDLQAFSGSFTPDERKAWRDLLDFDRFRVAYDGADLVGVAGSHELELTLPGDGIVPLAGTTWVSVAPTHRRRGILTRLMDELHADIDERREPVAGLMASEGNIYERFGYGIATRSRVVEIDPSRARLSAPPDDRLRMIDPVANVEVLAEIYDRYRRGTPGEVSRSAAWIDMRIRSHKQPFAACHDDGYVVWTIAENWGLAQPAHRLHVVDLVAATPDAYAALWNLVLSVDLVGRVECAPTIGLDDPLPSMLTDQRAVRTLALHDFLWLRPHDVGGLLAARRYRIDDEFVVDVIDDSDDERWRVSGGPDGAVADRTGAEADVTLTRAAMGALVLGGVTATELARGGRLESDRLARVDAFFGWAPTPHCATPF